MKIIRNWISKQSFFFRKNEKRILSYKYPIIILSLSIVISIAISFLQFLSSEQKTTITLSILGISFAIFQFLIAEINIDQRRNYDIKYAAYWEIVNIVEAIIEAINTEVFTGDICANSKQFISTFLNKRSLLVTKVSLNDTLMFKDILSTEGFNSFLDELEKILDITIEFKESNEGDVKLKESHKDWGTKILDQNIILEDSKSQFYSELRSYLK